MNGLPDVPLKAPTARRSTAGIVVLVIIVALLSATAGMMLTHYAFYRDIPVLTPALPELPPKPIPPLPSPEPEPDAELARFLAVFDLVREEYAQQIDPAQLWEGAVAGLVRATGDPYSTYMNLQGYEELLERTHGTYEGVGLVLTEVNEQTVVISPFPDTPADRAGMKPGDRIVGVNDRDVTAMPLDAIVALIRGPGGSAVTLVIERNDERFEVELTRERITIPTVSSEILEEDIGYLRISQFTRLTLADLESKLSEMESQGLSGLVLDLRNNTGGDLDVCVEIAQRLIPAGPIVHLVERDGARTTYRGHGPGVDYPIAVLVNGGSASASEILAAAIRDSGIGVLVGQPTFGKASVQTLFPLNDGAGIKLTTARYLTPAGASLDAVGLEPDISVEMEEDGDSQLDAAVQWLLGRRDD